ncbi:MAG TPA: hypothetical protein VHF25_11450 [Nitriliruptorales bacterium]|nr:hypothetical protein [Nitriliruptorales bacterium]
MPRSQPITRLEVAACPTHRTNVGHYKDHEVGCDCLTEERRANLARRLQAARAEGNPLADPAE